MGSYGMTVPLPGSLEAQGPALRELVELGYTEAWSSEANGADAMSQVESNIVELGTIFNKLAVMVNEHRDMVQRVEDNVEDANANLNLSLATLTDTLQNLQTNRALMAKVLGIVVLFIIVSGPRFSFVI